MPLSYLRSDTVENGKAEIALWFPEGIVEWTPVAKPWIYEDVAPPAAAAAPKPTAVAIGSKSLRINIANCNVKKIDMKGEGGDAMSAQVWDERRVFE